MRLFYLGIFTILWLVLGGCATSGTQTLAPFTTDGCSDFPDGTQEHKELWRMCCVARDVKYWAGGTVEERRQADFELRTCVQSVGQAATANVMLVGVRFFGTPWLPTSYRWGYGWPYTHGYKALTPQECAQVAAQKKLQGLD
ncbi:MAG: hypothetical protein ACOH1I_10215 [Gallionellaceae bacterium]